jgi:hypothetical protein
MKKWSNSKKTLKPTIKRFQQRIIWIEFTCNLHHLNAGVTFSWENLDYSMRMSVQANTSRWL